MSEAIFEKIKGSPKPKALEKDGQKDTLPFWVSKLSFCIFKGTIIKRQKSGKIVIIRVGNKKLPIGVGYEF